MFYLSILNAKITPLPHIKHCFLNYTTLLSLTATIKFITLCLHLFYIYRFMVGATYLNRKGWYYQ